MVGLGRHHGRRQHRAGIGSLDPEMPDDPAQRERRLGEREGRADADPRPRPERQVGKARHRRRAGQETARIEGVGVAPQLAVPVQQPGRDRHTVAGSDRLAGQFVRTERAAGQHEGGRVEPHRLLDHRAGERFVRARRFRRHGSLRFRREREEGAGPEQGHRRGLVPGQDHGGDLIAQLLVREAPAGLGIAGGPQQVEQVARLAPAMASDLAPTLPLVAVGDDLIEEGDPIAAEAGAGLVERRGEAQGHDQIGQVRAPEPRGVGFEEAAQAVAVAGHADGEHGAPGDLQGEPLERGEQIDRPP